MDLGIRGRQALVTAGSRGFGLATARRLVQEGAHVALCARGREDVDAAVAALAAEAREAWPADPPRVRGAVVDVTDADGVAGFVAEHGPADLLLVNAGGPPAGNFEDLDPGQWRSAYDLTLESAVRLCRLVLPGMAARGWGRVVVITSVSVKQPVENLVLSSVMRPAVQALVRTLSDTYAARGVTVNAVAPGYHTTSAVERLIAAKTAQTGCSRQDVLDAWTAEIPAGRLGDPDELAALAVFLMSRPAAYVTGQGIVSDGGWVKGTF